MRHRPLAARLIVGGMVTAIAVIVAIATLHASNGAAKPGAPRRDGAREIRNAAPPLAWSSWNSFMNSISASVIERQARAMVSSGLKAAGFRYINIDEGWWQGRRDSRGDIVVNRRQWPGGMGAMVRRIHALGLRAGIYTDVGRNGCGYYYPQTTGPAAATGSQGHYRQDLTQFARWGFDYVKIDWCGGDKEGLNPRVMYHRIAAALVHAEKVTGHHMTFSICEWGVDHPWTWGPGTGDLWRISGDISYIPNNATFAGVLGNADIDEPHAEYQHNGRYNDPDMMEVGADGLSPREDRSHLSLWAILGAPMVLGNNLTEMSAGLRRDITNRDMLEVDQDPLGLQGYVVSEDEAGRQVWSKTLYGAGRRAVVLLNRGVQPEPVTVRWADLGLSSVRAIHSVWGDRNLRVRGGSYTAMVPPSGAQMLIVTGTDAAPDRIAPRSAHGRVTFPGIPGRVAGFTTARLAFANPTGAPQTLMLADNADPASEVTLPPTHGARRTMALTLRLHRGTNSVTVSRVSSGRLRVGDLAVTPRPGLPPRALAAAPSSTLSGAARRTKCSACVGGHDVSGIGRGAHGAEGALTMRLRESAADAGHRALSVWYVDPGVGTTVDVSVNGSTPRRVAVPSTFGSTNPASVRVTVTLHPGVNTVRFSGPTRWPGPDVAAVVTMPATEP